MTSDGGDAIVVTGLGALSALGPGVASITRAMQEGRDGLTTMEREEIRALHPVRFAGWLREPWESGEKADVGAWSIAAAREAWVDARAADAAVSAERIAVVLGTTVGDAGDITGLASLVADALGARGPRWTVSTACASSANAIGLGRDLLVSGDADVVVAGGAERLVPGMFAGFAALHVLAEEKCAPFGATVGTTLGEGAGFLVLERSASAAARGARVYAHLVGYGLSSDAWHETTPDPRGEGIARATSACLLDAALAPEDVDYVNAHATGTAANDDSEWRGIQKSLGARATAIPVSGSKGFFGHAQGAAGALETLATLACMAEGTLPPGIRVGAGRLRGPTDPIAEGRSRAASIDVALSNSAAFGGANAVVAVARTARARVHSPRAVSIAGIGAFSTARDTPRDEAALATACGDIDLRGTDPAARLVIAASTAALGEVGLRIRGAARERSGIFGGASRPPAASVEEFKRSLDRGLDRASAPAFARTVGHAPVGTAARIFGLRGPMTMVAGEGVAGLLAIAYAARWLATRTDVDRLLAGGLDERAVETTDGEGAAFVLLGTEARGPRLASVATAGSLGEAITRALASAARRREVVDHWAEAGESDAPAFASASVCLDATRAIRDGARVAVACAGGRQGGVAIVLEENR